MKVVYDTKIEKEKRSMERKRMGSGIVYHWKSEHWLHQRGVTSPVGKYGFCMHCWRSEALYQDRCADLSALIDPL